MEKNQIEAMHQDIADVLAKYGVGSFVGVWFANDPSDLMGYLKGWPPGNVPIRICMEAICEKLQQWCNDIAKGKPEGRVQVVSGGNSLKN